MPPTGTGGLANVTLETYFQRTSDRSPNPNLSQPSCLACHTTASISKAGVPPGWTGPTDYASDYSSCFTWRTCRPRGNHDNHRLTIKNKYSNRIADNYL